MEARGSCPLRQGGELTHKPQIGCRPQERMGQTTYYFVNIMGTSALIRKSILDSKKLIPQLDLIIVRSIV